VGANGTGKTTLLRLIAGDERASSGHLRADGRIAFMPQFIGMMGESATVRDLLLRLSPESLRRAGARLQVAEAGAQGSHEESAHLEYADDLVAWGEAGGFDAEVLWDTCSSAALGKKLEEVSDRLLSSLSGGEQKRLALEVLLRSDAQVLLLDEPDNFLDIPATRWLEQVLNASAKTILFVSHDRALLAAVASRVVTIEGRGAWTHPGSYSTYHEARARRLNRLEEEHRRFQDERDRLTAMIREFKQRAIYNDKFATKAASTEKRLERFERDNGPPERARQDRAARDGPPDSRDRSPLRRRAVLRGARWRGGIKRHRQEPLPQTPCRRRHRPPWQLDAGGARHTRPVLSDS
jgi:ATPase subunit of ABC transporter with duplicated ATPase domains